MRELSSDHPLRRLFAGLTEQAFQTALGIADPPLIDYVSGLLSRFVHIDQIYRLRDTKGQRLGEVVDMLHEAQSLPAEGRTRREVYRHIGDFTLFWTGLFPESVPRLTSRWSKDHFIDYCEQGKRSYFIASTCEAESREEETAVLFRLSKEFELCAFGLQQVRKEWEQTSPGAPEGFRGRLLGE